MLFFYALVNVVAGVIAIMLAWNGMKNVIVYNTQDVVCVCVFYWGVRKNIQLAVVHKLLFWGVFVLSVWAVYLSHSFLNAYSNILIYGFTGFTSLIILFKLTSPDESKPMQLGVFWLLCGFIIYSFSELSLYFLLEHIMFDTRWGNTYFRIYNLLVMLVTSALFLRALLWKNKN